MIEIRIRCTSVAISVWRGYRFVTVSNTLIKPDNNKACRRVTLERLFSTKRISTSIIALSRTENSWRSVESRAPWTKSSAQRSILHESLIKRRCWSRLWRSVVNWLKEDAFRSSYWRNVTRGSSSARNDRDDRTGSSRSEIRRKRRPHEIQSRSRERDEVTINKRERLLLRRKQRVEKISVVLSSSARHENFSKWVISTSRWRILIQVVKSNNSVV